MTQIQMLHQATRAERNQVVAQVKAAREKYALAYQRRVPPEPRFTLWDTEKASDEWQFNCGPASICAALNMTPDELRPKMLDFERKGYTNPTLMLDVLHGIGCSWDKMPTAWPLLDGTFLMRVQWGGPWCNDGVPMAARYRHTHWVACWNNQPAQYIFDVNAMCAGGWLHELEWHQQLAPWLIKQCEPKGDGKFWPTHSLRLK
jgi:hypothetical protein